MFPLLTALSSVRWRVVGWAAGIGGLIALIVFAYLQHVELEKLRVAYDHPKIEEHVKIMRVQGPVRIITRTITTPGRTEVVKTEDRAPVIESTETAHISTPVFNTIRTDRYILGAFALAGPSKTPEYGFKAGYSFNNRLDIACGLSGQRRAILDVSVRF